MKNKIEKITATTSFEDKRSSMLKFIKKNPNKTNVYLAKKFGLSSKQIYRIKKQINENEESVLTHGNKYKIPHNKIKDSIRKEVVKEYENLRDEIKEFRKGHEAPLSITNFHKQRKESNSKHVLSYSTVVRIMNSSLVATPFIAKKTRAIIRRLLKRLVAENLNPKDVSPKELLDRLEEMCYVRDLNKEKYQYGECIEIDACDHPWFDKNKYHLYHAIDASTGRLLGAWMEKEETNHGYMQLLDRVFKMHGIPYLVKTDKRRSFFGTEETDTGLKLAIEELGACVKSDSSPTFKSKVEGSFGAIQKSFGWLFYKFRWTSPEDFNNFTNQYVNWYNRRYKKLFQTETNAFIKKTKKEIDENFMIKISRKVSNGIVRYNKKYFVPYDKENKRVLLQENANVSLYINKDDKLFFKANNKIYRADQPKANSLTNYEMFCIKSNIDVNDELAQRAHKVYTKALVMMKEASRRNEELNIKWKEYHIKRKELQNWENNLKNNT